MFAEEYSSSGSYIACLVSFFERLSVLEGVGSSVSCLFLGARQRVGVSLTYSIVQVIARHRRPFACLIISVSSPLFVCLAESCRTTICAIASRGPSKVPTMFAQSRADTLCHVSMISYDTCFGSTKGYGGESQWQNGDGAARAMDLDVPTF